MRFPRGAHARGDENVAHTGWGPASFSWPCALAGPYLVRAHGKVSVLGTSQPYVQQGLVLVHGT